MCTPFERLPETWNCKWICVRTTHMQLMTMLLLVAVNFGKWQIYILGGSEASFLSYPVAGEAEYKVAVTKAYSEKGGESEEAGIGASRDADAIGEAVVIHKLQHVGEATRLWTRKSQPYWQRWICYTNEIAL